MPDYLKWNRNPAKPTIPIDPAWRRNNRFGLGPGPFREQWLRAMVINNGWRRGAELGVWKGRTFLFLLDECPTLTLIGVDLWEPQPDNPGPENYADWQHAEFERKVRAEAKRFGDRAVIIKDLTVNAAEQVEDESLDFIFIDADHSEEAVRADITAWSPKVKPEGWIFGHDINWPTVKAAADDLLPGYVIGPDNAYGRRKDK